eukprot:EG_transcript_8287
MAAPVPAVTPRSPYNYPVTQSSTQAVRQTRALSMPDKVGNMERGPDGRYYGPRIISRTLLPTATASQASVSGQFTTRTFPQPTNTVISSRPGPAAEAWDAADGVMDGRYFGLPIQERFSTTQPPVVGFPPQRRYSLATHNEPSPAPLTSTTTYRRYSLPAQLAAPSSYWPQSTGATALDAADGVLDGKYFGHPIIERGQYYPASTYVAADGSAAVTPFPSYPNPTAYPSSPLPVTSYPIAPTFGGLNYSTAPGVDLPSTFSPFQSAFETAAPVRRLSMGPTVLPAGPGMQLTDSYLGPLGHYEPPAVRRFSLGPSPGFSAEALPLFPDAGGLPLPGGDQLAEWHARAAAGLAYPPTVIYQVTPIVEVIPHRCPPPVQRVCPPCYPAFAPMAAPYAGYPYAAPAAAAPPAAAAAPPVNITYVSRRAAVPVMEVGVAQQGGPMVMEQPGLHNAELD